MEKKKTIALWNLYKQDWMTTFMRSWIGLLISFWIIGNTLIGLIVDSFFLYKILSSLQISTVSPFPFQGIFYLWIGLGVVLFYIVQTSQEQENPQNRPQNETIWSKIKYQISLFNTTKTFVALGIWLAVLCIIVFFGNYLNYEKWENILSANSLGVPGWAFYMIGWGVLLILLGLTPGGEKLPISRTQFISIIFAVFLFFGVYLTKVMGTGITFSRILRTFITWFFLAVVLLVILILSFQLNFLEF